MAAVDSLLRVVAAQSADGLTLATGQVPRLLKAGFSQSLSMPAVGAALMDTFVAEVLPVEHHAGVDGEGLTVGYGEWNATVSRQGGAWTLAFRKRPPGRPAPVLPVVPTIATAVAAGAAPAPIAPAATSAFAASAATSAFAAPAATSASAAPAATSAFAAPAATSAFAAPAPAALVTPAATPVAPALSTAPPVAPAFPPGAPAFPPGAPAFTPGAPAFTPSPVGPVAPQLERWLDRASEPGVSDLLLAAGRGAWLRSGAELVALPGAALSADELAACFAAALGPAQHEALARHGSADLAWVWRGLRFRVNLFRHEGGLSAALRPVRRDPPTLAELDLPPALHRLVAFANGLVLVTGPTGSGKSTTLVALIEHLNRSARRHVVTLEDPIEYTYQPALSLIHQRELGSHTDSFEAGLRAALREAPDVILVGEMRDRATIAAALTAAETGHLVLSTLHAAGAAMAVERVVDAFPEHQQRQVRGQLAGCLRAVLTQQLLPGSGGRLVPVVELMLGTPATATLIRDGKTHQLASVIQTGRDDGMIALDRSLAERVEARQLSLETAVGATLDGGAQLRALLGPRR
jgi:twitching motility protein PilT